MRPAENAGRRALFVSSFAPILENGRALRTYAVVRALAALGPLDVAYVPFPVEEPSPAFAAIPGVSFHVVRPSRGARRMLHHAQLRASGLPGPVARSASPELVVAGAQGAAERTRGLVVAGDFSTMYALLRVAGRRPVAYNAHNVESSYNPSSTPSPAYRLLLTRAERRVLATAAESWMVSRRDMELARGLTPAARLRYVPNVVDVDAIEPVSPPPGGRTVMMLADFLYGPNVASAEWLVSEVMPRVWAQLPDARLLMAGRASDRVRGAEDPRVERPGFVEDLRATYARASAVAVPLVRGGGTPLKFVEALAYGVPVVSTGVAARGLDVADREHFRLGDDPARFAEALLDVVRHGDPAMTERARALVAREYSIEAVVDALAAPVNGRYAQPAG